LLLQPPFRGFRKIVDKRAECCLTYATYARQLNSATVSELQ
jgi:hypothetical protein